MTLRSTNPDHEVPDDLVLWRYLDFPKFLDLLASRAIKLPRASKMEDPFEGVMGSGATKAALRAAKGRGEKSYLRNAVANREQHLSFFWRERTYVSCWNAFPSENAGLWRIYGDDKGVVVRSTWRSLRQAFTGNADVVEDVFFGPVSYREVADDSSFPLTFTDQFFVKRAEFVHEHEFRLVAHDVSRDHNYGERDTTGLPQFATLECDLDQLIEEVLISPRLGGWVRDTVEDVSRKYGGAWPVRRSAIYQPPPNQILDF
ncbi:MULTISPECIES: hypothetical protein [Actinomycetes]|nr:MULTISPECIES: hypothetical protein [Actinomycetes]MAM55440.1 hypothetical protein [Microbacterium sp.]MAU83702.1 hypothetical protein [Gordonia sp. (in: high G+C Gram-positive bacteria)]|tara:strand:- start:75 stop:851 length:777 start_codon:yes stop_codon:yes gene_type:complete